MASKTDCRQIGAGFCQPDAGGARPFVDGICGFSGGFTGGERRARDATGIVGGERARGGGCSAVEDFAAAGGRRGDVFGRGSDGGGVGKRGRAEQLEVAKFWKARL